MLWVRFPKRQESTCYEYLVKTKLGGLELSRQSRKSWHFQKVCFDSQEILIEIEKFIETLKIKKLWQINDEVSRVETPDLVHSLITSKSFFWGFGISQLTRLQFIHYHVARFYKPTIPQRPPSHLRDYSICNNARLIFTWFLIQAFDPNEWGLKNGFHSWGLNPGPLGHESSALTTRPRLLAKLKLSLAWEELYINMSCLYFKVKTLDIHSSFSEFIVK